MAVEEGVGLPPTGHGRERVLPVQDDPQSEPSGPSPGRATGRSTDRLQCSEPDGSAWPTGSLLDRGLRSRGWGTCAPRRVYAPTATNAGLGPGQQLGLPAQPLIARIEEKGRTPSFPE